MLTKSLHTITAAINVARFILTTPQKTLIKDSRSLAVKALDILGYTYALDSTEWENDITLSRIDKQSAKLFSEYLNTKKVA